MSQALAGWVIFWLTFAVVDIIAARYGMSLSATVRWTFQTDTKIGALVFTVLLSAGSIALLHHIISPGGK